MVCLKNRLTRLEKEFGQLVGPTVDEFSKAQSRIVQRWLERFTAVIEKKPLPRTSPAEEERDDEIVRQWCEFNGVDIVKEAEKFQIKMERLSNHQVVARPNDFFPQGQKDMN